VNEQEREEARLKAINKLELAMIKLGCDFETHGGKKVRYLGYLCMDGERMALGIPINSTGEIEWTSKYGAVMVKWDALYDGKHPSPILSHQWNELEVIEQAEW
jgi:hypothetical protein